MTLSGPAGVALLGARVLFAAALGTMAASTLRDLDYAVAYAGEQGAPAPRLTVPLASLSLLAGAGAVLLGALPLVGAALVAAFLVVTTPVMHDFWAREGDARAAERVHFLKNAGLLAGALLFAALAGADWPYALAVAA